MILVDTCVWIDHLHHAERALIDALHDVAVLQHPMILGELALGTLADRTNFLRLLTALPQPRLATTAEVLRLVETAPLYGHGLGVVDAHLLASTLLTPGIRLWTRDRRLRAAAVRIGARCFDES